MTQPIPMHVLCAYLPYSPKVRDAFNQKINLMDSGEILDYIALNWKTSNPEFWHKLLLRPLPDLSKPLAELEGKTALKKIKEILSVRDGAWPKVYLDSEYKEGTPGIVIVPLGNTISIRCVPDYYMVPLDALEPVRELLLSLHFDLFGAIQQGWALDLNQSPS